MLALRAQENRFQSSFVAVLYRVLSILSFALKRSVFVCRNLFLFKCEDQGSQDSIVGATHKQMSAFHLVIYPCFLATPLVSYLYDCVLRQKYLYKYLPLVFSCPLGWYRIETERAREVGELIANPWKPEEDEDAGKICGVRHNYKKNVNFTYGRRYHDRS